MSHILLALSGAEQAGKGGVHLATLLASAQKAGKAPADWTTKGGELRQWLEGSGIPVTKSVKLSGDNLPGVRVDRVTEALGMPPGEAYLAARFEAPAEQPRRLPQGPFPRPFRHPSRRPSQGLFRGRV